MKRYRAVLFWEGHGHSDRDHYTNIDSDDLEELKERVARETLSGDGYNLVVVFERLENKHLREVEKDIETIRAKLRHDQAMLARKRSAEKALAKKEEKKKLEKRMEERQYQLYLELKEKFEK